MDEGYIKFNYNWVKAPAVPYKDIAVLNSWRNNMRKLGLIGIYDNGIGYGNISKRYKGGFIITGSATGNINKIDERHYTLVNEYSFKQNSLTCKGPVIASSESLSHAAIYECSSPTNAVIHIHNLKLWKNLLLYYPSTKPAVKYGTPEMAEEIKRLFIEENILDKVKVIIMEGHKEGVFIFGDTLKEAGKHTVSLLQNFG